MMTIVEQGGFQYKVAQGDKIRVPLMQAAEGVEVALDRVLPKAMQLKSAPPWLPVRLSRRRFSLTARVRKSSS